MREVPNDFETVIVVVVVRAVDFESEDDSGWLELQLNELLFDPVAVCVAVEAIVVLRDASALLVGVVVGESLFVALSTIDGDDGNKPVVLREAMKLVDDEGVGEVPSLTE